MLLQTIKVSDLDLIHSKPEEFISSLLESLKDRNVKLNIVHINLNNFYHAHRDRILLDQIRDNSLA